MSTKGIYLYQPKAKIDTSKLFELTMEGDYLRVKNKNVNCVLKNLTAASFDEIYNEYLSHLNLNFSPLNIDGKIYQLKKEMQEALEQKIIFRWLYFYTVNNLPVKVRRKDFHSPSVTDQILALLDKKYGVDTEKSLKMGAHLLRRDYDDYCISVKARRWYYDR